MADGKTSRAVAVIVGVGVIGLVVVAAGIVLTRRVKHETAQPVPVVARHGPAPAPTPLVVPTVPAAPGRHSHLTGARTEALCTSLADVRQFYDPSQDQTQDGLSCSLILAGKSAADVVVYESHGSYVRVRLSDNTGHFSDGYMRRLAVQ